MNNDQQFHDFHVWSDQAGSSIKLRSKQPQPGCAVGYTLWESTPAYFEPVRIDDKKAFQSLNPNLDTSHFYCFDNRDVSETATGAPESFPDWTPFTDPKTGEISYCRPDTFYYKGYCVHQNTVNFTPKFIDCMTAPLADHQRLGCNTVAQKNMMSNLANAPSPVFRKGTDPNKNPADIVSADLECPHTAPILLHQSPFLPWKCVAPSDIGGGLMFNKWCHQSTENKQCMFAQSK
jgi:hypothetical protein